MRQHVTFYDETSGLITRRQRIREGEPPQPRAGEAWKWGRHDASLERIDLSTGEAVPLCEAPLTIAGNRIEGVPAGARVAIGATSIEATGEPIEVLVEAAETVRLRIGHEGCLHTERQVDLDPAANNPAAAGAQLVEARQDPVRMRLRHYPSDGDQLDALCKAMGEVLEASPQLRGPGVAELRGILDQRAQVKAQLPKRGPKP